MRPSCPCKWLKAESYGDFDGRGGYEETSSKYIYVGHWWHLESYWLFFKRWKCLTCGATKKI
jgi:hypothetical protein